MDRISFVGFLGDDRLLISVRPCCGNGKRQLEDLRLLYYNQQQPQQQLRTHQTNLLTKAAITCDRHQQIPTAAERKSTALSKKTTSMSSGEKRDHDTMAASSSTVPTSCIQVESTVINAPIDTVWKKFRELKLEGVAPGYVKSTEGSGGVGSIVKITYVDGTVWELQITEVSVSLQLHSLFCLVRDEFRPGRNFLLSHTV